MALPLLIAAAPAIIGGLGSIFSQAKAGKTAREAKQNYITGMEDLFSQQQENLDKYVKPDMFNNPLETEFAQSTLAQVREQLKKNAEATRKGVASSGATPEAAIAATTAGSSQYADIINKLYGQGTQYKQAARDRYVQGMQGLLQGQMGYQGNLLNMGNQQAQNYLQLGENLASAGAGLSSAAIGSPTFMTSLSNLFPKN